jgi:hypothetical protein
LAPSAYDPKADIELPHNQSAMFDFDYVGGEVSATDYNGQTTAHCCLRLI